MQLYEVRTVPVNPAVMSEAAIGSLLSELPAGIAIQFVARRWHVTDRQAAAEGRALARLDQLRPAPVRRAAR
jgi:hypothetical protein